MFKNLNLRIIDKYIAKHLLLGVFVVSSILLGIAWFSQIFRLLSYVVNDNIGFFTFLRLTSLLFPSLLSSIFPISLFVVVLFVYNKLVLDKELIVMQSVGQSTYDLTRPAITIAKIITGVCLFITIYLAPKYETKYKNFLFDSKNDVSALLIKEGEFNEITNGLVIYVNLAKNNILENIFIHDSRNKSKIRTIIAGKGMINTTQTNMIISLLNGSIQENNNGRLTIGTFEKYTADLGVIAKNYVRRKQINEYSLYELIFAKKLGLTNSTNYNSHLLEVHKRLLRPFLNLIFTLIALLGVFKSSFTGRGDTAKTSMAILFMVLTQMFYMRAFEFIRIHYKLFPILYLFTIVLIILLFKKLYKDKK